MIVVFVHRRRLHHRFYMFFLFCYFIRFSFCVDFQFSVVVLSFSSFVFNTWTWIYDAIQRWWWWCLMPMVWNFFLFLILGINNDKSDTCCIHLATSFTRSSHIFRSSAHNFNGIWKRPSTATINCIHISKSRWYNDHWTATSSKVTGQCCMSATVASGKSQNFQNSALRKW